ncbi:hypothetical protein [Dokdonella sp.]|uniref:RCC1 domain-containing protein n=1 Tax=Dokdonella sp. TaxID=2291710 RepID=UPI001B06654F|nr:hypothetical protein [Dokdonella sp.]MBO9664231.1 hypothetical protein [Dokdonella sp.]
MALATAFCISFGARAATLGTGLSHSCALADAGRVKCWGANNFRQLGDATTTDRLAPVDVTALVEPVTAIAVGGNHTCGLTVAGRIQCWGFNQYGQLGDGTTAEASTAVDVVGLSSAVTSITAGRRHSCALTSAGAVKCWGSNERGQLGDGGTTDSPQPVDVVGLQSGVVAVAANGYGTCVVTSAGAAKCWGDNTYGQVGDGTTNEAHVPVEVAGLGTGVSEIATAETHACARLSDGRVKCWGVAPLGDGTQDDSFVPVDVQPPGAPVAAMSMGFSHACALASSGQVTCWGYNGVGEVGDGTYDDRYVPTLVEGLESGVTEIASSYSHTCARLQSDELRCWGSGSSGQLGNGVPPRRMQAVDVVGLKGGALAISAGSFHTCAVTTGGVAKCWGDNLRGQLGDSTHVPHWLPADVQGLDSNVESIVAGDQHTCARTNAGGALCWGSSSFGQVGGGVYGSVSYPMGVTGMESGTATLASGRGHSCAVTESGAAKCWGLNNVGQLGDGTNTTRPEPMPVSGLASGVVSIAAGYQHTCAITTLGSVKCWGSNDGGELGDGTTTSSSVPVDVVGLNAIAVAITTGASRTCVLTDAGVVKCWGAGTSAPTEVVGLGSGVAKISSGTGHTCAVNHDGGLKCWGYNQNGQLGDGTLIDREFPVDVVGLTSEVASVSAGDSTTCAITQAGVAKCWGSNGMGQLGNGEAAYAIAPQIVIGSPFSDWIFRDGFD